MDEKVVKIKVIIEREFNYKLKQKSGHEWL